MFIFLDDLRTPPPGSVLCRTAAEALTLLATGEVTEISFDHDLGIAPDGAEVTGYHVANQIEAWVAEGSIPMPAWRIHSANPVGRSKIEAAMLSTQRIHEALQKPERYTG